RWLGYMALPDLHAATDQLLGIAAEPIDLETRAKAIAACVRLLGLTRNAQHIAALEILVSDIGPTDLDCYQRLHVTLASAWILATRRRTRDALSELTRGVEMARAAGIGSSIAVRLLLGQSNLLYALGNYEGALAPLHEAERLARNLDNITLRGECAAQLALVEGRLGRPSAQIDWARLALRMTGTGEWSAGAIGASYELGLGLAMAERYGEAQATVVAPSTRRATQIPAWAAQAAMLCGADVLALCGSDRKAIILARRATEGQYAVLATEAYAGQFSRWVALIAIKDGLEKDGLRRLRDSFPSIEYLDAKDQAELLAAMALLDSAILGTESTAWPEVAERLRHLPVTVGALMRRLGVHAGAATIRRSAC
ncbi:MAG TPA: hypothetical protein VHW65_11570, partial [Gemmatimonadales bacterium]|nr:hypothetical protein [Gemmatimonadales bacterium]